MFIHQNALSLCIIILYNNSDLLKRITIYCFLYTALMFKFFFFKYQIPAVLNIMLYFIRGLLEKKF